MGVALLEVAERAVENVFLVRSAHRDVFQLGLEVDHVGQRHALAATTLLDDQALGQPHISSGFGAQTLHLLQGLLQTLAAHRLGQVVHRFQVKSLHRVFGVGGDEHHRRWRRQLTQGLGQGHAVHAGHVDVQHHQITSGALDQLHRLHGVGRLAHHVRARLAAFAQQSAQPGPRQCFIVNDQYLQCHVTLRSQTRSIPAYTGISRRT
ncbi:hypothetical protein FQZ97_899210 [compost metagenome]